MRHAAILLLGVMLLLAGPSFATGEMETPPEAGDAELAEPWTRNASLLVAPAYLNLLDGDTRAMLGDLYGGALTFKYHLIPWFATTASVGYLVGNGKQDVDLDYASYRRLSFTSVTPVEVGFFAEILPRGRVNPFIGAVAGGMYLAVQQSPEDIESNVPIAYDELDATAHAWLPTAGGKIGLDVRVTDWVGLGAAAAYRWTGGTKIHLEIPGVRRTYELQFFNVGIEVGLFVYF
jgi:hypothetical protein